MNRKMLVLNVAALSPWEIGSDCPTFESLSNDGTMRALAAPEPALTCPSHATMLTGLEPKDHGIVANGWYDGETAHVANWGRSDRLVAGEKIWEAAKRRAPDFKTVNLFWRFCTHSSAEITLTERPTYFANGRKGADVYGQPQAFRDAVSAELGSFPFFHFWGPKAGLPSSKWIVDVARKALRDEAPDLLLCYAPGLDYEVQRFGPKSDAARGALRQGDDIYRPLIEDALSADMDVCVVSDYGFTTVDRAVFPNRILREAGYITIDPAVNGALLEPGASRAFAVCDNQAAHVYVNDPDDIPSVRALLLSADGIRDVHGPDSADSVCLGHKRSGQLLAIAEPNTWFAYPYWTDASEEPDFAHCVDIFRKPGFDPCELFLRQGASGKVHMAKRFLQLKTGIRAPFDVISTDTSLIRGSRNIRPESDADGAVLLTSWRQDDTHTLPMSALKQVLLDRIFGVG